jgi:hypothetical protein
MTAECIVKLTTGSRKGETGAVMTRETPDPSLYWIQLADGQTMVWESEFEVVKGEL